MFQINFADHKTSSSHEIPDLQPIANNQVTTTAPTIDLTEEPPDHHHHHQTEHSSPEHRPNSDMMQFADAMSNAVPDPAMLISQGVMAFPRSAPRRAKRLVPEAKKDYRYWEKRQKNNEAAKRSRENRRRLDFDIRHRMLLCEEQAALLKKELDVIKTKFGLSLDKRYLSVDSNGELVGEQYQDIYPGDFAMGNSHDHHDDGHKEDHYDVNSHDTQSNSKDDDVHMIESPPAAYSDDHNIPMKKRRIRYSSDASSDTQQKSSDAVPHNATVSTSNNTTPYIPQVPLLSTCGSGYDRHLINKQISPVLPLSIPSSSGSTSSSSQSHCGSPSHMSYRSEASSGSSPSSGYETGSSYSDTNSSVPRRSPSLSGGDSTTASTFHGSQMNLEQFASIAASKRAYDFSSSLAAHRGQDMNDAQRARNPYQHLPTLIHSLMNTSVESVKSRDMSNRINERDEHSNSNSFARSETNERANLSRSNSVSALRNNPASTNEDEVKRQDSVKEENEDLRGKLLMLSGEIEKLKHAFLKSD